MFLTFPIKSVQAEAIGERINRGDNCRLETKVLYHFYGHEQSLNWLQNRLQAIDKNLEKDIKHCLK